MDRSAPSGLAAIAPSVGLCLPQMDNYTTKWAVRGLLLRRMYTAGIRHLTLDGTCTWGRFSLSGPDSKGNFKKLAGQRRSQLFSLKKLAEELHLPKPYCPELWGMYGCFLNGTSKVSAKFLTTHVEAMSQRRAQYKKLHGQNPFFTDLLHKTTKELRNR